MSFLSIAFMAALPLLAAPILLHLFDRRRSVVIQWGAMQFLMEAATRNTNARRFQQWLLLLLRVLALAALVLALARPLLPGHWFGSQDRRETVLIVDNSLSTSQRFEHRRIFDELIAKADQAIQELGSGNTIRILTTSPYPAWSTPASLRVDASTRADVVETLKAVQPTRGTGDLPAALLKAVQSDLQDEQLVGRHVILFTDGQRKDWRTDDTAGWSRFKDVLNHAKIPTSVEVVEVGQPGTAAGNLAVTRVRKTRSVVGVHQTFSVVAEIRNHASTPSQPSPVTWSIDDKKFSVTQLPALQPGETHDVALRHSFGRPGIYSLDCQIAANDQLVADNDESTVVEVVERVPVLLIEGSEGFAEIQQDAFLVRAALGRIEGEEAGDWRAVFEPRTIAPQQLESIDLDGFRAVVIPNLIDISEKAVNRLTSFVADGGGLWLALGPRTNVESFNKLLFNDGDGLSPVGLSRIVDEAADDLQKPTINPFLKTHPATAELADNDRLDTGDIKIARRFRFQMPMEAGQVSVLLDLSNGDPLVVENRVAQGRIIVQAIPLRFQWSDLTVSQAFVVMVHDWLGYLTEPGATRHNLLPGDPIALQVTGSADAQAILTTPSGEDIVIAAEPLGENASSFRTGRTAWPGRYSLEVGLAGSKIPFHVARDAGESDLTQLTTQDRALIRDASGLEGGRLTAQLAGTNERAPVWPALLVLLILFMIGDLLLSGWIARKRFGMDPISETVGEFATQPFPVGVISERNNVRDGSRVPSGVPSNTRV